MQTIDLMAEDGQKKEKWNRIIPKKPYQQMAFEEFVRLIEDGGMLATATWRDVAKALEIGETTLQEWRKHPLALEAKRKSINKHLKILEEQALDDPKTNMTVLRKLGYQIGNDESPAVAINGNVEVKIINYSQDDDKPKQINADSVTTSV